MQYWCRWLSRGLCGILALLTVSLVLPGLVGIRPLIVQSKSMEPTYPSGSIIYVKKMDKTMLKEGMVITFYLEDEETLITHRIIRIDNQNELIYTKGDANELEDRVATPMSRVMGSPAFYVPYFGYVAEYLSSVAGKIGILLTVAMVCILSWMDGMLLKAETEVQEE